MSRGGSDGGPQQGSTLNLCFRGLGQLSGDTSTLLISATSFSSCLTSLSMFSTF